MPNLFRSEDELRTLWSTPITRQILLEKLDEAGFGKEELSTFKKLIDAEKSDLFDVLEYVFNSDTKPMTREAKVAAAQATIFALLDNKQKEFIELVLSKYERRLREWTAVTNINLETDKIKQRRLL